MLKLLEFFNKKRVFITGHTGFKGSWLTLILLDLGAEVRGYALTPNHSNDIYNILNLNNKIISEINDINNEIALKKAIMDFKPEIIIHLAAQALVKDSYSDPLKTFNTNIIGSANLLSAVNACDSIKSLVFITSDKCYQNKEWIWGYREDDQLGGNDPYSASKAAAEIIFSSYKNSFFNNRKNFGMASARAGNVIGGGDWSADRIVPDCIRAISTHQPIVLRNPNATRPWQHVLDPILGYLILAKNLFNFPTKYSGSWNFGPPSNQVKNVGYIANRIIKNFGSGEVKINSDVNLFHEANLLQLNCDKANQLLGWRSQWSVDEAVDNTAIWYKEVLGGASALEVTRKQIAKYFQVIT
jgi:CDP-glucose 4,6-dehydratase